MKTIFKKFAKKYGYNPSIFELFTLYCQGCLTLTENEENALKIEFENNNLN